MIFWSLIVLLSLVAVLSIVFPVFGGKRRTADNASYDKSVYRDQLEEIDADLKRGQIVKAEAEMARAEIARRLIALDQLAPNATGASRPSTAAWVVSICAAVLVPVLSVVGYVSLGNPEKPDRPLQARLSADPKTQPIDELVARAEARVQNEPDDARGWLVLGPVYMRMNRPRDAIGAYQNIIRLSGSKPEYQSALGEAMTMAAGGVITADARKHFENARKADPQDAKAQFFLAAALGQEGKSVESIAAWEALIVSSPPNAPWLVPARSELLRMQNLAGVVPAQKPGGPTREQMAAAADMSDEDRNKLISNMVAGLAIKLEQEPNNLQGWLRLIRSYAVLGNTNEAAEGLKKATAVFSENPTALGQLTALAQAMKIGMDNQ